MSVVRIQRKNTVRALRGGLFGLLMALAALTAAAESEKPKTLEEKLDGKIFLDLRDINIIDLFKFIGEKGEINVVTSKNVQGRSTMVLHQVAIRDALDILVISNQLAYEIEGDIIYIMTADEYTQSHGRNFDDKRKVLTRKLEYAKPTYAVAALQALQSALGKVIVDEETGTVVMIDTAENLLRMNSLLNEIESKLENKVIELKYAKAKDVETQLKPNIDGKGIGNILADERSNQILLSAYPKRMDDLVGMVGALDKKTKAVLVEAKILQLTLNPRFDMGIDWEKTFRKYKHDDLKALDFHGIFPIDSNLSTDSSIGTVGKFAIGEIDDDDFEISLKALKAVENTKVLANPRLMILDREEAKINIGDRLPYVVTTTTGTGNSTSVSEEIKFIDVGIILTVTPVINEEGFITMKIRPEISSKTTDLRTPTQNLIPVVNTTYIETAVVVKDGITIILGGLRRDNLSEHTKGIPGLMNMPVMGHLFKNRDESLTRTEIVIFITPHIVEGDTNVTDEPFPIKEDLPLNYFSDDKTVAPYWKQLRSFDETDPPAPAVKETPMDISASVVSKASQIRRGAQ